jgi:hypothetical protein
MSTRSARLFHSLLSFALNTKMLHPHEVVQRAQALFRHAVGAMQHACGVNDAVPRALGLEVLGGPGNGGFIVQIDR